MFKILRYLSHTHFIMIFQKIPCTIAQWFGSNDPITIFAWNLAKDSLDKTIANCIAFEPIACKALMILAIHFYILV